MGEVNADGSELSEAAQAELLEECEEQFTLLEKLQNEIILSESDFCQSQQEQSINRLTAIEAELKQWQAVEPKLLATNPEILRHCGKQEMLKLCSELQMVGSCCEAKIDKLKETKELEQKWQEEKKQVLKAISDHTEHLRQRKAHLSGNNLLDDIKGKVQKIKAYQKQLLETLGEILEEYLPVSQNEAATSKKKKNTAQVINEDHLLLNEILEMLMNKALNAPHDPYVTIDDTFWPPYVEMLLRYGIAVRHQENNFKIRLETFF